MLKFKIAQNEFDKLDASAAKAYKQEGDFFILQVEGGPTGGDDTALKKKNEQLLASNAKLKEQLAEANTAVDEKDTEIETLRSSQTGAEENIAALKKSWQDKYDKDTATLKAQVDSHKGTITGLTSEAEAVKIASEIALEGSADVLLPHIAKRLTTEFADDGPRVTVLGSDGKPSALTTKDLAEEFSNNPAFSAIIRGTGGTGSGHQGGGGGEAAQKTIKRSAFDQLSQPERASFAKDGGQVVDD